MDTSEKFCLKWNGFQENVNTTFAELGKDNEFTDVTLACQDGHQVEAHKVILATSSPFFKNLLKRNKHAHPLIYMRGIKSEDLLAVVDFLYYGETNIHQENLDTFLNIAKELELKGLAGEEKEGNGAHISSETNKPKSIGSKKKQGKIQTLISPPNILLDAKFNFEDKNTSSMAVALPKQHLSGDIKELNEQIETMISRGENMLCDSNKKLVKSFICQVCGKESGQKINIKDHIEANHLEGVSIPCNFCEKTFRTRDTLRKHNSRNHTNSN